MTCAKGYGRNRAIDHGARGGVKGGFSFLLSVIFGLGISRFMVPDWGFAPVAARLPQSLFGKMKVRFLPSRAAGRCEG